MTTCEHEWYVYTGDDRAQCSKCKSIRPALSVIQDLQRSLAAAQRTREEIEAETVAAICKWLRTSQKTRWPEKTSEEQALGEVNLFNGDAGAKPQTQARRWVYGVLATMLENAQERSEDGWFALGPAGTEFDRRRLNKALDACAKEMIRKARGK